MTRHSVRRHSGGFTIVELMIATMVFSVILTVVTMGVISFSNRYYKGVHTSATQSAARSIMDTITQSIQFGSATVTPSGSNNFFCAGGSVFLFDTNGVMFNNTPGQRGVYVTPKTGDACVDQAVTGGRQLLGNRMRVASISVAPLGGVPNMYQVSVVVAYGDDTVLCAPSLPQQCQETASYTAPSFINLPDITCKPGNGNQYCAVSRLKASVQKRVVPS
ncbi:prepilin-type N-terminal cleavage/methylation domain-containing protein [Candidatus Saccharibacteria bacterium]|nr:MAG: prepilin-type N-terminal cleavage/methylation domain-containing protein [Candidatus Saccharibacteria bacterium]